MSIVLIGATVDEVLYLSTSLLLQVCYKSLQSNCGHQTLSLCLEECLEQLAQ